MIKEEGQTAFTGGTRPNQYAGAEQVHSRPGPYHSCFGPAWFTSVRGSQPSCQNRALSHYGLSLDMIHSYILFKRKTGVSLGSISIFFQLSSFIFDWSKGGALGFYPSRRFRFLRSRIDRSPPPLLATLAVGGSGDFGPALDTVARFKVWFCFVYWHR